MPLRFSSGMVVKKKRTLGLALAMPGTYSITAMATQNCAISKILGLVVVRRIQMVTFLKQQPQPGEATTAFAGQLVSEVKIHY